MSLTDKYSYAQFYPLTAPNVNPLIIYLCINHAAMSVGSMLIAAPAAMVPYCTSIEPQKEEISTVIVVATFRENKNANKNSIQDQIMQKTEVVAMPGRTHGRIIAQTISKRP